MYYTYVLKSTVDNNLYTGCTNNIVKRVKEHNEGLVLSTRSRKPLTLVYYEACLDKNKAYRRKKYFKTGFGRRFLSNRI